MVGGSTSSWQGARVVDYDVLQSRQTPSSLAALQAHASPSLVPPGLHAEMFYILEMRRLVAKVGLHEGRHSGVAAAPSVLHCCVNERHAACVGREQPHADHLAAVPPLADLAAGAAAVKSCRQLGIFPHPQPVFFASLQPAWMGPVALHHGPPLAAHGAVPLVPTYAAWPQPLHMPCCQVLPPLPTHTHLGACTRLYARHAVCRWRRSSRSSSSWGSRSTGSKSGSRRRQSRSIIPASR